jgi:hypothetical protein
LEIVGGATTATLADAVPPVPPSVDVTLPLVLFCVPAAVPLTLMLKLQEVLAASVAPDRLIALLPATAVIVPPPHEPVSPFGVATTRPAGSVSPNPIPFTVLLVLLFWTVKVRLVVPFNGMLAAPKALISTGGATTVMEAFDVFPVPKLDVTWTLLFLTPAVVPVTVTTTVHDADAASVPAVKVAWPEVGVAAVPPQPLLTAFDTVSPAGMLSVNAIALSATLLFGLAIVNVSEVVPFNGMLATVNAFVIVGGSATVRVAVLLAVPVPPLVELTAPVVFE